MYASYLIDLAAEIGPLPALADDEDLRLIDHRGPGHRLRDAGHLHAFDERPMHPLVNGHLIEEAGEPLAIVTLAVHLVLRSCWGFQRIRLQNSAVPWVVFLAPKRIRQTFWRNVPFRLRAAGL